MAKGEIMTIKEQLKKQVLDALAAKGFRCPADRYARSNDAIATALETIDIFFRNCEEMDADEYNWSHRHYLRLKDDTYYRKRGEGISGKPVNILIHRPTQQTVTVTHETLAVLAKHYEETPGKTEIGKRALAEAKDKL